MSINTSSLCPSISLSLSLSVSWLTVIRRADTLSVHISLPGNHNYAILENTNTGLLQSFVDRRSGSVRLRAKEGQGQGQGQGQESSCPRRSSADALQQRAPRSPAQ